MLCVIAVESDVAQLIIENLKQIEAYSNWEFEICDHTWKLDEFSMKKPDVLVLSRFLPGEESKKLLQDLPVMFSGSHIILLVGELNEQARGYLRVAKKNGLENYVTGTLPGDRPYTIVTALRFNRDSSHGVIELPEEENEDTVANEFEENLIKVETKTDQQIIAEVRPVFTQPVRTEPTYEPEPPILERQPYQLPKEPNTKQYIPKNQQQLSYQQQSKHLSPVLERQDYHWKAPRGHLISVIGNKGGVGKTTTSVTLAVALAHAGVESAIVDIDLASPNVADFFKIEVKQGIEFLAGRARGLHVVLDQVLIPAPKHKNIHVLPGPVSKSIPVEDIFQKGEIANILSVILERFQAVIVDTPANFRVCPWIPEVFQITDLAIAVVDQSDFSEQDTARFAPELLVRGIHPQNIRIILNRFSPKLDNAKKVEKAFQAGFKKDVPPKQLPSIIATIPHDWDVHVKSGYKGETVGLDDARSQWHRIGAEIAAMVGTSYEKAGDKQQVKKNNTTQKKRLFGFLGRKK